MSGTIPFPALPSVKPRLGSTDKLNPTTHFHPYNQRSRLQERMKTLRNEVTCRQASHDDAYLCPANNGSLAYGAHLARQYASLATKSTITKSEEDWLIHLALYSQGTCLRSAFEKNIQNELELRKEFQTFFDGSHETMMGREGYPRGKREKLACELEMAGTGLKNKKEAIEKEIARKNASENSGTAKATTTQVEKKELVFETIQDLEDYIENQGQGIDLREVTLKFQDDETPEPEIGASLEKLQKLQERFDLAKRDWDGAKKVFIRNREFLKSCFQRQREEIPSGFLGRKPWQGYLDFACVKSTMATMFFTHSLAQDDDNPSLFTTELEDAPGKHSVEFVGGLQDDKYIRRYISEIFYAIEDAFTRGALTEDMLLPREDYFVILKSHTWRLEMSERGVHALYKPAGPFGNTERSENKKMAEAASKKKSEAEHARETSIASALRPKLAQFLTRMKNSADQTQGKRRILDNQGLGPNDFLSEKFDEVVYTTTEKGTIVVEKKRKNEEDDILAEGSKQRTISAPPGLRRATKKGTAIVEKKRKVDEDDDNWAAEMRRQKEEEDDMFAEGPKQRAISAPPGLRRVPTMRLLSLPKIS